MLKQVAKSIIVWILQFEARLILRKYKPCIVAVTGTVGKTSTKDAIGSALAPTYNVRRSAKSFNGELGVPLTIIGCESAWSNPFLWLRTILTGLSVALLPTKYPEFLVLEVGTDRPGDIKSLCRWLHPDITVITCFADVPVHVEKFESAVQVIEEKLNLVRALKPNGILLLGSDDGRTLALRELFPDTRTVTFGTNAQGEIRGVDYTVVYSKQETPQGVSFSVVARGVFFPVRI